MSQLCANIRSTGQFNYSCGHLLTAGNETGAGASIARLLSVRLKPSRYSPMEWSANTIKAGSSQPLSHCVFSMLQKSRICQANPLRHFWWILQQIVFQIQDVYWQPITLLTTPLNRLCQSHIMELLHTSILSYASNVRTNRGCEHIIASECRQTAGKVKAV